MCIILCRDLAHYFCDCINFMIDSTRCQKYKHSRTKVSLKTEKCGQWLKYVQLGGLKYVFQVQKNARKLFFMAYESGCLLLMPGLSISEWYLFPAFTLNITVSA